MECSVGFNPHVIGLNRVTSYEMNAIENKIVEYIKQKFEAGSLSVTASEILAAVVPAEHPEFQFKPSYNYALERLIRRNVINGVDTKDGVRHYFIGNFATSELLTSLGL